MSLVWVAIGILGLGLSGFPGLTGSPRSNRGQEWSFVLNAMSSLVGMAGLAFFWGGDVDVVRSWTWSLPGGRLSLGLDGLSGLFLIPVFVISALGSLYGLDYWKQSANPETGRALRFFYGWLGSGMGLVLIARNSVLFLFGWEIMALSAYFLVSTEFRRKEAQEAAWIYWMSTHAGVMALMIMFILLRNMTGSFEWEGLRIQADAQPGTMAVFLLALFGFGLKAGVMPFHFWLPKAHSSAPSHVSGILSGVMLNMGVYGLFRVVGFFKQPPLEWGVCVLFMGAVSAVAGILLVVGERDIKRMLAYSSIENIGIIFLGLGLALVGRSLNNDVWVVLGLCAAFYHLLNHSLFKTLLFFCSGSILHTAQTRKIDGMGGLIGLIPWTAFLFAMGSCAACALPPLNGFIGEWILYRGLMDLSNHGVFYQSVIAIVAVGSLGLVGSLGVLGFVRVFGIAFLGVPRSTSGHSTGNEDGSMKAAMFILAAACLSLAFIPQSVLPVMDRAMVSWVGESSHALPRLQTMLSLGKVGQLNIVLFGVPLLVIAWMLQKGRVTWFPASGSEGTWGCGFTNTASPRLQYTASSFGETVVRIYQNVYPLRFRRLSLRGMFPPGARFETLESDWILGRFLRPTIHRFERKFSGFRAIQQGKTSVYILYILLVFILALAWGIGSLP